MQLALTAKSDINGLTLGYELAEIYLWVGVPDLALSELEALKDVPLCLFYGDLRKDPTWDRLQGNPRFERLLMGLGPITPVNTPVRRNRFQIARLLYCTLLDQVMWSEYRMHARALPAANCCHRRSSVQAISTALCPS